MLKIENRSKKCGRKSHSSRNNQCEREENEGKRSKNQ